MDENDGRPSTRVSLIDLLGSRAITRIDHRNPPSSATCLRPRQLYACNPFLARSFETLPAILSAGRDNSRPMTSVSFPDLRLNIAVHEFEHKQQQRHTDQDDAGQLLTALTELLAKS